MKGRVFQYLILGACYLKIFSANGALIKSMLLYLSGNFNEEHALSVTTFQKFPRLIRKNEPKHVHFFKRHREIKYQKSALLDLSCNLGLDEPERELEVRTTTH